MCVAVVVGVVVALSDLQCRGTLKGRLCTAILIRSHAASSLPIMFQRNENH